MEAFERDNRPRSAARPRTAPRRRGCRPWGICRRHSPAADRRGSSRLMRPGIWAGFSSLSGLEATESRGPCPAAGIGGRPSSVSTSGRLIRIGCSIIASRISSSDTSARVRPSSSASGSFARSPSRGLMPARSYKRLELGARRRRLQIFHNFWLKSVFSHDFKGFAGRATVRIVIDRYVHAAEALVLGTKFATGSNGVPFNCRNQTFVALPERCCAIVVSRA